MTSVIHNLVESEYIRERITPEPGDQFYLVLSDLLEAIRMLSDKNASNVLDFGCGGSPYRSLFNKIYHGADIVENLQRDITLIDDCKLPPQLASYDLVFSTQVLEHVGDPRLYLSECYRALRPGGQLVLTTHGSFEDHPCPEDYWRWTASGLRKVVEQSGLTVKKILKITTQGRASLFLLERDLGQLSSRSRYNSFCLSFKLLSRFGTRRLHKFADKFLSDCRVVEDLEERHTRYIALGVSAVRPTGSKCA
jgi:SAM-dependent methyltransferase